MLEITAAPVGNGIVFQPRHQAPLRCVLAKNGAQDDNCENRTPRKKSHKSSYLKDVAQAPLIWAATYLTHN